jgi:hypothetical protein
MKIMQWTRSSSEMFPKQMSLMKGKNLSILIVSDPKQEWLGNIWFKVLKESCQLNLDSKTSETTKVVKAIVHRLFTDF